MRGALARVGASIICATSLAGALGATTPLLAQEPAPKPAVTPSADAPSPAAPTPAVEEPRLGFDDVDMGGSSASEGVAGAWAVMIKGTVALAAVLLFIYLVLGKGLAKLNQKTGANRRIHILDRVGLDHRRTLYLVEIDGVRTVVGAGEGGMSIAVIPDGPKAFKDLIKDAAAPGATIHDPPARDDAALGLTTPSKSQGDA